MIPTYKLAPYLPFDLQFEGGGDIWTLISMTKKGDVVLRNGLRTITVDEDNVGTEYKPILRPLSDMTKSEAITYLSLMNNLLWKGVDPSVKFTGWLIENHFDVYQLIEA